MADDVEGGLALAGWLVASTILTELVRDGVIRRDRARDLIDAALLAVENISAESEAQVLLTAARVRLDGLITMIAQFPDTPPPYEQPVPEEPEP